ncbi:MAG: DUF1700 domain-containing protein [Armatimonadota bacterium]
MKKDEFLSELHNSLGNMSDADKQDVLNDYEEHFRVGMADGRSEEEIAKSLGNPSAIGATYRVAAMADKPNGNSKDTNRKPLGRTYLRDTIFLLVAAFLMTGLASAMITFPFHSLIKYPNQSEGITGIRVSALWMILLSLIASLTSLGTVILMLKGIILDKSRRPMWIILLVLGLLILSCAIRITLAAPMFYLMYQDIRQL